MFVSLSWGQGAALSLLYIFLMQIRTQNQWSAKHWVNTCVCMFLYVCVYVYCMYVCMMYIFVYVYCMYINYVCMCMCVHTCTCPLTAENTASKSSMLIKKVTPLFAILLAYRNFYYVRTYIKHTHTHTHTTHLFIPLMNWVKTPRQKIPMFEGLVWWYRPQIKFPEGTINCLWISKPHQTLDELQGGVPVYVMMLPHFTVIGVMVWK